MRSRFLLSILVAAILGGSLMPPAFAGELPPLKVQEPKDKRGKNLERLLELSVDFFELNKQAHAKAELDKLIAENPSDEECWRMREAFGERILRKMAFWMGEGDQTLGPDSPNRFEGHKTGRWEWSTLGGGALEVLYRAKRYDQKKMLDPKNIREVVRGVVNNPNDNPKSLAKMQRIGQYAVPDLIDFLATGKDETKRSSAAYLLRRLGPLAVMPLAEALNTSDSLQAQHIVKILGDIRPLDMRCLPILKQIYDDEKTPETLRAPTAVALNAITGIDAKKLPPASTYFFREANRYYKGGPLVREELVYLNGTYWVWNAEGGRDDRGRLEKLAVPSFILDDILAEELVYDGMRLPGDRKDFQVLLASVYLQQAKENQSLRTVLDLKGITMPGMTALIDDIKIWRDRLYKNQRVAWTIGPNLLVSVLDKAIVDGKSNVAISAIEGIEKMGLHRGWRMIRRWHREGEAIRAEDLVEDDPGAAHVKTDAGVVDVSAKIKKKSSHPVILALDSPDRRVRYAAANCLARIGLPASHGDYRRIVPVLIEGAREKSAIVCLVISNDPKIRKNLSQRLEENQIMAVTAAGGREGFALATQFPPKDCILIDSKVQEFSELNHQLNLRKIVTGSEIPLVIVTARSRANEITAQFKNKRYKIHVRSGKADDPRLYQDLKSIQTFGKEDQMVVILTNEKRSERKRIKESLILLAEKHGRPERQSELLRLLRQKSLLTDTFGIRSTFVNVFLDEDLSGFDTMRTLQRIRQDMRTRHIPVAILSTSQGKNPVLRDYKEFMADDKDARWMDNQIGNRDLLAQVQDMTKKNSLSSKFDTRELSDLVAQRSADALKSLDIQGSLRLTAKEIGTLQSVLKDASRSEGLRSAVAGTLGYFGAESALKALAGVFREAPRELVTLRVSCLNAIGHIDVVNEYKKLKMEALNDTEVPIQEAAARALSIASVNNPKAKNELRRHIFDEQRINEPLSLFKGESVSTPRPELQRPTMDEEPAIKEPAAKEGEAEEAKEDEAEEEEEEEEEAEEEEGDW